MRELPRLFYLHTSGPLRCRHGSCCRSLKPRPESRPTRSWIRTRMMRSFIRNRSARRRSTGGMVMRVHLACCASLLRHREWLNTLLTAIEGDNLFGTYAACRGFLESAADAVYSLAP